MGLAERFERAVDVTMRAPSPSASRGVRIAASIADV